MAERELRVLLEAGPCLVVSKPAGVSTQAPAGIDSLEVRIRAYLEQVTGREPEKIYLGVPHRLDRPASGAIVFCTRRRAPHKLSKQFERRQVKKVYWALVSGRVSPPAGTWEDSLRKIPGQARVEVVPKEHPEGRMAVLHYRALAAAEWGTWLEIQLETGRPHQVRVQAATRGHPLLGDAQYGSNVPFGPQYEDARLRAIALHARILEFCHPVTKTTVSVTAPVASEWEDFLPLAVSE
jgi:23S rRNA pseudouridine1911/1915/1917 synthase